MPSGFQCRYIDTGFQDQSNPPVTWFERYFVLQYNQCLGEIAGDIPTSYDAGSTSSQFDTVADHVIDAAIVAMTQTCGTAGGNPTPLPTTPPVATATPQPVGQTNFNVISVRFEKNGGKDDFYLKNPPLTQVKTGSKVRISVYVNVSTLGAPSVTMNRTWSLKLNGKSLFQESKGGLITDTDIYHYYYDNVPVAKAGTYNLSVSVEMDGKTDTDTAKLKAVKKVKTKKISFSFTKLQLQSGTIHAGQQATASVDFTVKHLKGHTTALITRTVLAQINGQWKGVSTNSNSTVVLNGTNHNTVSTQFNAPGSFQIQVTVTVGSKSQTKAVPIIVTR
jgi:hypothetical protein